MAKYETTGGTVSKALTFSKLIDLLSQAADQCFALAHLQVLEDSDNDSLQAKGYRATGELLVRAKTQLTELATKGVWH